MANVSHILADKTSPHLQSETVLFGGDLGKTFRFTMLQKLSKCVVKVHNGKDFLQLNFA